jgi:hypothetical protein
MTRGRVCCLQVLMVLSKAIVLFSESRGTHDHIFLSNIRDPQPAGPGPLEFIPQEQGGPVIPPDTGFPFHRLLLLVKVKVKVTLLLTVSQ